jgi:hypothetical protein
MGPDGADSKNDCAGEGQLQFTGQKKNLRGFEGDGHDLIDVRSRRSPGRKEESYENSQDYRRLDRNSNPVPPDYWSRTYR